MKKPLFVSLALAALLVAPGAAPRAAEAETPAPSDAEASQKAPPFIGYRDGTLRLLGPAAWIDFRRGRFRLLPFIQWTDENFDLLWPLVHWSARTRRVLPVIWGSRVEPPPPGAPAADDDAPPRRRIKFLTVFPAFFCQSGPAPGQWRFLLLLLYYSKTNDSRALGLTPLFNYSRSGDDNVWFWLLNVVYRRSPERRHIAVFPFVSLRRHQRPEAATPDRSVLVFPFHWTTRDDRLRDFAVLPFFTYSPRAWSVMLLFWKYENGFSFFPFAGRGLNEASHSADADSARSRGVYRWRYAAAGLYYSRRGDLVERWPRLEVTRHRHTRYDHLLPVFFRWGARERTAEDAPPSRTRTTLVPLALTSLHEKKRPLDPDEPGAQPAWLVSREISALALFYRKRVAVRASDGTTQRLSSALSLIPFYFTSSNAVTGQTGRSVLPPLFVYKREPEAREWSVMWGLLARRRVDKEESRFGILGRLFFIAKTADGQRRLRLFFLPAIRLD